jgi:antitoxin (DNA-binding transcriptional repressor) of toxin-antitoxin stability system
MQNTLEKAANTWQLHDAEVQFAELVTQALAGTPQTITSGDQSVVVISSQQYQPQEINGWDSLRPGILFDNDEVDNLFARRSYQIREAELE